MLPEYVSGEAIGVSFSAYFGIGDEVHLAVSLFEGLDYSQGFDLPTPGDHLIGGVADRVPKRNHRVRVDGNFVAGNILRFTINKRRGVAVDLPDKPPRNCSDQRMIQIALTPHLNRPSTLLN